MLTFGSSDLELFDVSIVFLSTFILHKQSLAVFFTISLISALVCVDNLDLSRLVFCLAMLFAVLDHFCNVFIESILSSSCSEPVF